MDWKNISVAIALIAATVGAVTYFTPLKMFEASCVEFKADIEEIEERLAGIDVAYLCKRLARLHQKYNHTNCWQMPEPDKSDCEWLKESIARYGGCR